MKYLIELVADPKGLEPAITAMDELNAKEKELKATTTTVSAEQKKMLDAYAEKAKLGKASVDKLMDGYKQLGKAATGAFGNEAIKGATKAAESFRSQLRGSREEVTKLFVEGKATTSQIYEAARAGGDLKDAIGDAQQAISVLSSDTFKFDAALQGVQLGAAGFQAITAGAALFGEESEDLQKVLVRLNAVMAFTQSIQQIVNLTQKQTALSLGVNVAAQNAYKFAVGQSTGALLAFRVVLATLTGGIILAGIIALVANWEKIRDAVSGSNEEMRKSAELRKEANKSIGSEIGEMFKLKQVILDQSLSYKTRNDALKQLKEIAPEYASSIKNISVSEAQLNKVIAQQTELLIQREEVRILANKIAENEVERSTKVQLSAFQKTVAVIASIFTDDTYKKASEKIQKANEMTLKDEQEALREQLRLKISALGDYNLEKEKLTVDSDKKTNKETEDLYRKSLIARRELEAQQEKLFQEKKQKDNEDRLKILRAQLEKEEDLYRKSLKNRRDLEAQQEKNDEQRRLDASKKRFETRRDEIKAEIEEREAMQLAIKETSIQIAQQTADAIFQIVNTNRNNEFNAQIQDLNTLRDRELANKELSEGQKARIEERYQRQIAAIKTKQAQADKQAAIVQATINGALAITKILATLGGALNPAAIASIIATVASTATQIAIIASTKIPKFAKGTEFVQGSGTETSDSVPAMLSRGERVIDAKTNKLLKGIPNKMLPQLLIPDIASTVNGSNFDYNKMAKVFSKELANNPALMVNFDKSGFNTFIKQGVTVSQIKNNRNGV